MKIIKKLFFVIFIACALQNTLSAMATINVSITYNLPGWMTVSFFYKGQRVNGNAALIMNLDTKKISIPKADIRGLKPYDTIVLSGRFIEGGNRKYQSKLFSIPPSLQGSNQDYTITYKNGDWQAANGKGEIIKAE